MSEQPENKAARPRWRRWLRRLLYGIVVLPAVVIALLGLAVTGPVLRLAMPKIDRAVSAVIDGRFETGTIHGSLWTGLTVDRLLLEIESTGLQVDGRRLELVWSPLALVRGIVQVDRLAAGSLSVVLPRGGAEKVPAEGTGAGGPLALPLSLRLGQLYLPEFRLVDPASGRQFSYKIEASAAAEENLSADLALALLPLDGDFDRLRASLKFNADKQELDAEIDGRFDRAGMVMTLAGLRPEDAADVTVSLKGNGTADRWQGDLGFAAGDLAELSGKIGVQLRGEQIGVTFSGAASTLAGLAEQLPAPVRGVIEIDLAGQFDAGQHRLAFSKLNLAKAGLMTLSTSGDFDLQANRLAANLRADITDLSMFGAIAGLDLSGTGRVVVNNVVWGGGNNNNGGQADIEIAARQLGLGQADLNRLVGPQPVIAAAVELSPQLDLGIRLSRLETAMASGAGVVDIVNDFKEIKVNCELAVQPGAVPPAIGVAMVQAAHLTATLEGPLTAPAGDIRLTLPKLEAGGEKFENLVLATSLIWSEDAVLSLSNRADFALRKQPYRLSADVVLPPDRLRLDMALSGAALDLAGQLELPGYQPPMRGAITLSRLDAGLLGDWGMPVAAGQLAAKFDFVPVQGKQRIDLDATAGGLRLAGVGDANPDIVDRLAAAGHINDALGEPVFAVRVDGAGIAVGPVTVAQLRATLQGALAQMRATVEAKGQFEQRLPVTLAASADLALAEDVRVAVDRFDADIGTERITLRRKLQLTRTAKGVLDVAATFAVGKGRLDGRVRFVPDREFDASADLRDIALAPWGEMFGRKDMTGTLTLAATLHEQEGKAPRAQIDAEIGDIRVARAGRLPPLRLQLDGALSDGEAHASLSLGRPDLQVIRANGAVPLTLSVLKGQGRIDPAAPISAHADIDGEIAQFWPYVPLPDHALAGRLKLAADLSGSLAAPVWDGAVNLQNGRYEHLQFGTLLRNIRIDGRFDRRGVRISEISADDGSKGRLTGKAEVVLGDESKEKAALAYRAEIAVRGMALTRMDELQLWADVDLNVAGDRGGAKINGDVTVQRGEVDLAVALPASVARLDIANLPDPEREEKEEAAATGAEPFAADLAVTVNIPGRVFVRGKGLDSEWGGRLAVTGQADNPRIVGELNARRGQLDIIGKTFAIRDSRITFAGEQPPDPLLGIVGVHTTDDLLVTASLSGPARSTKLTLSSEPDMPQDEILSRILFGKSQGNLTTVEAIQLASAAAELSGKGGGLDVVGSFRRFISADVLRVEGGEAGPNVEVGKYLAKGVYVGTKRGTTPGSSGVEVEIELTPHIKVTSESNEVDNKAGLQFKWDY